MKFSSFNILACIGVLIAGCVEGSSGTQFSSRQAASGLDGGFRPNETLEVYGPQNTRQRRGMIEQTGDYYNYGTAPRDIEIVPAEAPTSSATDSVLAPKRVEVLGGCSKDRVTDKTTCRMNVLPQGLRNAGGLYQTVDKSGTVLSSCIIGHDFPGRSGFIRVDGNSAITTDRDGCIYGAAARRLEAQLRSGSTLITRRVEWPYDYHKDKEMLIGGSFSAAQDLYRWSASANLSELFPPN